jgi:PII-like signaling protein
MDLHRKKRLEIVLEAPGLRGLLALFDRLGVAGYTVVPALSGRGHHGPWDESGQVTDAGRMVMVVCVIDPARLDEVLPPVYEAVERRIGILTVSDVEVVRGGRF